MTAVRHTWVLLGVLLALLVVDGGVRLGPQAAPAPVRVAFGVEEASEVRITRDHETLVLRREGGGWRMGADPADAEEVEALLTALGRGVALDLPVDDGEHERYGLTGADPVRVEVWGPGGPLARLYVGADAPGGATFVRLPDHPEVYRARIGGRERFVRRPSEWVDRRVLPVSGETITSVEVVGARFEREPGGPWVTDDPDLPPDQALLDALARMLGTLRADGVFPPDHPGMEPVVGVLQVGTVDGEVFALELARTEQGAFGRLGTGQPVLGLPHPLVELLLAGREAWRDRTLVALPGLASITLRDAVGEAVATREGAGGTWRLVRPHGVEVDPRRLTAVARALAALRADDLVDVTAEEAGLPGRAVLTLVDADGERQTVEIGGAVPGRPAGQEQVYARAGDRIGVIRAQLWAETRHALGR